MSGVDGWWIDGETAQLSRDSLKGNNDGISRLWRREQLIRLNVEGGQYCREQPALYVNTDGQHSQEDDQH